MPGVNGGEQIHDQGRFSVAVRPRSPQRKPHACRTRRGEQPRLRERRPHLVHPELLVDRVSATSRHVSIDRDQPPTGQPHPAFRPTRRSSHPREQLCQRGADPNRPAPGKIADLPGNGYCSRHPEVYAKPSVNRDNTSSRAPEYRPIPIAKPPSPAPATGAAPASDPKQRSPQPPTPAGTPASTPPPTPDPTTDPTSAWPTRTRCYPTNHTHVVLTERYWI